VRPPTIRKHVREDGIDSAYETGRGVRRKLDDRLSAVFEDNQGCPFDALEIFVDTGSQRGQVFDTPACTKEAPP
jgi:hypothetical protein